MKRSHQLVLSSLAVLVLTACSGGAEQRRQAKDDFAYLESAPLMNWNIAEGEQPPQYYTNYSIPEGNFEGGIGTEVDIRPPQQVLELIPGARIDENDGEVTLWLIKKEDSDRLWETMQTMISERGIPVESQTDDRLETGWVKWVSEDEEVEIGSRYEVSRFTANNRNGFKINLIDWSKAGERQTVTATERQRYNVLMTNLVMARHDAERREEAKLKAQELVKQIPIMMGTDRSGLPVIIARASYDIVWESLPRVLPKMGFEITSRTQSEGRVEAKYSAPDDEFWEEIGITPVNLGSGDYTFLLGDLGNRTSMNVTDSKGKPVTEDFLKSLQPILAATIQQ